ncbi:unnamed protein product, partial [Heterosigma akashiwo]
MAFWLSKQPMFFAQTLNSSRVLARFQAKSDSQWLRTAYQALMSQSQAPLLFCVVPITTSLRVVEGKGGGRQAWCDGSLFAFPAQQMPSLERNNLVLHQGIFRRATS